MSDHSSRKRCWGADVPDSAVSMTDLWRNKDPAETYSDWTIVLTRKTPKSDDSSADNDDHLHKESKFQNTTVHTYHVHKVILGAGPRYSTYFKGVFNAKGWQESAHGGVTRIDLEPSACDAFPDFLAYIYTSHESPFQRSKVVALRFLADYFGVDSLHKRVTEQIKNDIHEATWPVEYHHAIMKDYWKEAVTFHDDEICGECIKRAANDRNSIVEHATGASATAAAAGRNCSFAQFLLKKLSIEEQNQLLTLSLIAADKEIKKLKGPSNGWAISEIPLWGTDPGDGSSWSAPVGRQMRRNQQRNLLNDEGLRGQGYVWEAVAEREQFHLWH